MHLEAQLSEASTAVSCECSFFTAMALLCHHMFRFHIENGMLFDESVVAKCWRKDYFLQCSPAIIKIPDVAAALVGAVTTRELTTFKTYSRPGLSSPSMLNIVPSCCQAECQASKEMM